MIANENFYLGKLKYHSSDRSTVVSVSLFSRSALLKSQETYHVSAWLAFSAEAVWTEKSELELEVIVDSQPEIE